MTNAELLAEIERLIDTVKRLEAPGVEVLVPVPMKLTHAILSALRGVEAAREALEQAKDYFHRRADAEYETSRAAAFPNEEMVLETLMGHALAALSQEEKVAP